MCNPHRETSTKNQRKFCLKGDFSDSLIFSIIMTYWLERNPGTILSLQQCSLVFIFEVQTHPKQLSPNTPPLGFRAFFGCLSLNFL